MLKKIGMVIVGATLAVAHCLIGGAAFADSYTQDGKPCPPECVSDSMEIVTWYPSPYNEYEELRLYPISDSNSQCNSENRGLMYYDNEDDKVKLCKGPAGNNDWQELAGGGWEVSGNNIYNTNSGNVGIGTTAPIYKFHLHENSANTAANGVGVLFTNNETGTTGLDGAFVGLSSDENLYLFNKENGNILLQTNSDNANDVIIKNNGNVGIGTTSPQEKLDINGNVKINGDLKEDGNIWGTASDISVGCNDGGGGFDGTCPVGTYMVGISVLSNKLTLRCRRL